MRTSSMKMNSYFARLGFVLLAATFVPASACTDAQKEQAEYKAAERKRTSTEKTVRERADLYWELIRWQDWDRAARFFEEPEHQLAFLKQVSSSTAQHPTREDVEVQFVFVSSDDLERAEVRIGWTEVVATRGSVRPRVVSQTWYKSQGIWWARPELPLGREEGVVPDVGEDPEGIDEAPPEDLPTEPAESEAAPEEPPPEDGP